jgi:hypothetical protein
MRETKTERLVSAAIQHSKNGVEFCPYVEKGTGTEFQSISIRNSAVRLQASPVFDGPLNIAVELIVNF